MDVNIDISALGIEDEEIAALREEAFHAVDAVWDAGDDVAAWVREPMRHDEYNIESLIMTAVAAQDSCGLFVIIGNGGVYDSIRAAVEASDEHPPAAPEIAFVGESVSTFQYAKILEKMRHYEVNVCVLSASGKTAETIISYKVIKEAMIRRYGKKEAVKRIMVITGNHDSPLRRRAEIDGCGIFELAKGFKGNYHILSSGGLFAMSVAGIDVKAFLRGAETAATDPGWDSYILDYAVARKIMAQRGKKIEIIQTAEPALEAMIKWICNLYAESEGHSEDGLYASPFSLAKDFTAMGQFLLGGKTKFFQTEIYVESLEEDMHIIGEDEDFVSLSVNEMNGVIADKVKRAYHSKGVQPMSIGIKRPDSYHLGQLMYFFMMTAAVSAVLFGQDPFERALIDSVKQEKFEGIKK